MTAIYNEVANLLELCRQPTGTGTDYYWPTADTWCQREYARDRSGKTVPPISADAASWCLVGRVTSVAQRNTTDITERADVLAAAFALLPNAVNMPGPRKHGLNFVAWNDLPGRTVQQIADIFDQAIAAARQEGDHPVLENAAR